jgi:Na+/H+-dicarboxylate symporter
MNKIMPKLSLHWRILIGLGLGVAWSILAIFMHWHAFTADWIAPLGEIFLRLLKLIAIPLVMFSIITGVAGLSDIKKLGTLGTKTIFIYTLTTVLAIGIGLAVVNIIKPGNKLSSSQLIENRLEYERWRQSNPSISPVDAKNILSDPLYAQYLNSSDGKTPTVSSDVSKRIEAAAIQKQQSPLQFVVDMVPENIVSSLTNNTLLLQVIFFSLFFGIALKKIPENHGASLVQFFEGLNQVYLKMIDMIMSVSPYFVFSLMAGKLTEMAGDSTDSLWEMLGVLIGYGSTVILGLVIVLFGVYPVLYAWMGSSKNTGTFLQRYVFFFKAMGPAQLLAFTTSSSAATLPLTLDCVHNNLKVSKETSGFVLPIGATINMDGTSLYQAVAVVFLAQFHWIDLSFSQQLTIVLTAGLASIGSAAVPSAGLIMLIMVLQSVNLNPAWIAIILPIDRILDMCRTTINVSGDGLVASLVEKWEQKNNN